MTVLPFLRYLTAMPALTSLLQRTIADNTPGRTVLMALIVASLSMPAKAQQEVDPEWPCIQRLIEEVSPAVMWPIPVEETMQQAWSSDDQVRRLAEQLAALDEFDETDSRLIADFAESIDADDLENRLTLFAVGVVATSNIDRKKFISGIKRYTRQQIEISKQIENSLNELSVLKDSDTPESLQKRLEIEDTLRWHERVYDQRERAIISLCEEPVELEEKISQVLREAAQYLP